MTDVATLKTCAIERLTVATHLLQGEVKEAERVLAEMEASVRFVRSQIADHYTRYWEKAE